MTLKEIVMFIATELQMAEHTSLESYADNLSSDLPSGIQLHAQMLIWFVGTVAVFGKSIQ